MLTQFLKDAKDKNLEVDKIVSYKAVTHVDSQTKKAHTSVKVAFLDKEDDKMLYKYTLKEGEQAKSKVFAISQFEKEEEEDLERQARRFLSQF